METEPDDSEIRRILAQHTRTPEDRALLVWSQAATQWGLELRVKLVACEEKNRPRLAREAVTVLGRLACQAFPELAELLKRATITPTK